MHKPLTNIAIFTPPQNAGEGRLSGLKISSERAKPLSLSMAKSAPAPEITEPAKPADPVLTPRVPQSLLKTDDKNTTSSKTTPNPNRYGGAIVALSVLSTLWFVAVGVMMNESMFFMTRSLTQVFMIVFIPPVIIGLVAFVTKAMILLRKSKSNKKKLSVANENEMPTDAALLKITKTIPFILEGLHSLSLDVTRMSENGVPKKTWDAYQKGDVGAFTRTLIGSRLQQNLSVARKKYRTDHGFRQAIQTFLKQFDDMITQAKACDHQGLLITTLGSSEVAKLYAFLCKVARRKPILS